MKISIEVNLLLTANIKVTDIKELKKYSRNAVISVNNGLKQYTTYILQSGKSSHETLIRFSKKAPLEREKGVYERG